ncbi:MAG TPA: aminotransferase class IV, partial [Flavisolibacter sp.]|nr:aminotransferase class IV [Flavisolibacter sp.]
GDGLFETMKVYQSRILFEQFHYDRLILGLKMLQIENTLNVAESSQLTLELCEKNDCIGSARVRLAVSRNHENKAEFVIEAFPLPKEINQWNENGLTIDLYPHARKNPDAFSNLKTANFLPYVLAGIFATERGIDDALVLNAFNHVADSSKANVFLIKKRELVTPALHQGCVAGVMRRFLLDELKRNNYRIRQDEISEEDLLNADEVFLTNSIYDIRRVQKFREKMYSSEQTFAIYQKIILPLY